MDIETMRKIVDDAPSDATDIDHTGAYWKDDMIMVDGKYREDTRGWALIKWRLSYLRAAIADHDRTDHCREIDMTPQQIKDNAPDGASHYLLVPNGSGAPYYLTSDGLDYYFFHSKDKFPFTHMIQHIKPL